MPTCPLHHHPLPPHMLKPCAQRGGLWEVPRLADVLPRGPPAGRAPSVAGATPRGWLLCFCSREGRACQHPPCRCLGLGFPPPGTARRSCLSSGCPFHGVALRHQAKAGIFLLVLWGRLRLSEGGVCPACQGSGGRSWALLLGLSDSPASLCAEPSPGYPEGGRLQPHPPRSLTLPDLPGH